MYERWPLPHTLFLSDPGGERFLGPLALFDPDERGGIALPGLLVIAPDGGEAYRYVGRDFADRTTDDEMFAALEGLGLGPIDPPTGGPIGAINETLSGAFRPDWFIPYFKGNLFAAAAIGGRVAPDDPARAVARQHRQMAEASLAAWDQIRSD